MLFAQVYKIPCFSIKKMNLNRSKLIDLSLVEDIYTSVEYFNIPESEFRIHILMQSQTRIQFFFQFVDP